MLPTPRPSLESAVRYGLKHYAVTALLGPRQCGKTTLARAIAAKGAHYFDVERPRDRERLMNPEHALKSLKGLVILDEFQHLPSLTLYLRVLADRRPLPAKFLILGSASHELMRGASDSLAGRIHHVDMGGFTLDELAPRQERRLWLRGGLPPSFMASSESKSFEWRENMIRSLVERDLPSEGVKLPPPTMRRFLGMIAHYHGQIWNGSEIGGSMGFSHTTARRYLDTLCASYAVRQLPPYFVNVGKRLVKSPKVYLRDSGILHSFLNIENFQALQEHPKLGASWEGFALEQILTKTGDRGAYFWATHSGAELDLLLDTGSKRWGFEIKFGDVPKRSKSMDIAIKDLGLEKLWIVYPGSDNFQISERIEAVSLNDIQPILSAIRAGKIPKTAAAFKKESI